MTAPAIGLAMTVLSMGAVAQNTAKTFEAATVKSTPPDTREPLDIRLTAGGRLTVTNEPLRTIMTFAYGVQGWQISGAPAWFETDRYDIAAKAEGDPSREEMLAMFRNLLEDRFRMKVHRETREGSIYELTVAKNGPKFQKAADLKAGERANLDTLRSGTPAAPGASVIRIGRSATMAMLASALQGQLSRTVADKTGLEGVFDFRVEYAAYEDRLDEFPSVFTALQDQLGLKLEPAKGPVETLVIDRVDRTPTAN